MREQEHAVWEEYRDIVWPSRIEVRKAEVQTELNLLMNIKEKKGNKRKT